MTSTADDPDRISIDAKRNDGGQTDNASQFGGFNLIYIDPGLSSPLSLTPSGFLPGGSDPADLEVTGSTFHPNLSAFDAEIFGTAGFQSLWTFQFLSGAVGDPIRDTSSFMVGRFMAVPISEPGGLVLVGLAGVYCGRQQRRLRTTTTF